MAAHMLGALCGAHACRRKAQLSVVASTAWQPAFAQSTQANAPDDAVSSNRLSDEVEPPADAPERQQPGATIALHDPGEALCEKNIPFRELGLGDTCVSDETIVDAMLRHPILINRLFVTTPLGTRLCRPSEIVLDILPPVTRPFAKEDGETVIDIHGQRIR